jgi:hypothetical protein
MIEPTDDQVAVFKAAWEAEADRQQYLRLTAIVPGARTRAGLRAVLNMGKS